MDSTNIKLDELPLGDYPNTTSIQSSFKKRKFKDFIFRNLTLTSSFLIGIVLISIVFFIGKTGLLVFQDVSPKEFFLSLKWEPMEDQYGAGIFIIGTFALTGLTLLISIPLGIIVAIFISEICPIRFRGAIGALLDLLVGIPSIVYGYLGLTILIPLIRKVTGSFMGDGLLAAALVLSIMVLPTIVRISENSIRSVPQTLREASYALGSTKAQMIMRTLLPTAKSGIATAVVLGMARAIGETMAVVMVIGNTPQLAKNLLTPTSVLTSNIVMQIINVQFDSTWNYALYMMAFLLLFISIGLILMIRFAKPFKGGYIK